MSKLEFNNSFRIMRSQMKVKTHSTVSLARACAHIAQKIRLYIGRMCGVYTNTCELHSGQAHKFKKQQINTSNDSMQTDGKKSSKRTAKTRQKSKKKKPERKKTKTTSVDIMTSDSTLYNAKVLSKLCVAFYYFFVSFL